MKQFKNLDKRPEGTFVDFIPASHRFPDAAVLVYITVYSPALSSFEWVEELVVELSSEFPDVLEFA
jgi:hypothetical protein